MTTAQLRKEILGSVYKDMTGANTVLDEASTDAIMLKVAEHDAFVIGEDMPANSGFGPLNDAINAQNVEKAEQRKRAGL